MYKSMCLFVQEIGKKEAGYRILLCTNAEFIIDEINSLEIHVLLFLLIVL